VDLDRKSWSEKKPFRSLAPKSFTQMTLLRRIMAGLKWKSSDYRRFMVGKQRAVRYASTIPLDMPLFSYELANELYLKRLIVGGFDGPSMQFGKLFRNGRHGPERIIPWIHFDGNLRRPTRLPLWDDWKWWRNWSSKWHEKNPRQDKNFL